MIAPRGKSVLSYPCTVLAAQDYFTFANQDTE